MTDYQQEALTPDHVDLDKPLSDDMKTWLINRNRADLVEENARRLGAKEDQAREAATAAANTAQAQNAEAAGQAAPDASAADDDYDQWTLAELQEEAAERKLAKSGTKAELIDRLRANDSQE